MLQNQNARIYDTTVKPRYLEVCWTGNFFKDI